MDEIKAFYKDIFNISNQDLIDFLASHSTTQVYKKNELIFNGNLGPQVTIPFLVEGAFKTYMSQLNSNDMATFIGYNKGESLIIFGLDDAPKNYEGMNILAIKKDTKVIHLDMMIINELKEKYPEEYNHIIVYYLNRFMYYHFQIARIRGITPSIKRVEELLKLDPNLLKNNLYGISQEHFASLIGLPRQTFNSCFKKITRNM